MYKRIIRFSLAALMVCAAASRSNASSPEASLIYFTEDGTRDGTSLFPGFDFHSCWSGLGATADGRIYVTVGNHTQPSAPGDPAGNVAVFKLNGTGTAMTMLGDLKSVSTAQGNWHPDESQHKVHTFLMEHADNRMYFATLDYAPSFYLRGSHMYYVDLANDSIVDFSAAQPYVMKNDFSVIPNAGTLSDTAGVFIQNRGIKGMYLNRNAPDLIYCMVHPPTPAGPGHLVKYRLSDGSMERIDECSTGNPYVIYEDNAGNAYYIKGDNNLYRYDEAAGSISRIGNLSPGFLGMVAPTASGDTVYLQASGDKKIYRLICSTGTLEYVAKYGGWWKIFNMTLDPGGDYLYVINNNGGSSIGRINVHTGVVEGAFMNIREYVAAYPDDSRDLCFGGVNTWDGDRNFYAPVWSSYYNPMNIALMKVHIPAPDPVGGITGTAMDDRPLLSDVFPSPMRTRVTIEFGFYHTVSGNRITITDHYNRTVAHVEGRGNRFPWDGTVAGGTAAAPGVYYYRAVVDGRPVSARIIKTE